MSTIPRVGQNVNLYAGTWTNVQQVWLDIYRYKAGAWTVIGGAWVANGGTLSYYLGTDWADSQIGFYAWGNNPTYGWSDPAWSGTYIVQPAGTPPQNTSPPSATGSFEVGSTVTLRAGTWNNAPQQYWIDLWRWTASGGWVYVSGTNIGSATQMTLTLGNEWAGTHLGFHAFAWNSSAGWSNGVWGGDYAVTQPAAVEAPPSTDNLDTPAVARNEGGAWGFWLSNDFHATVSHYTQFQTAQSTPLVGDWDGDGIDSPGVNIGGYRWILSNGYDGEIDHDFVYGLAGDKPVVGDWNGDGLDTVAVRREHYFYFKNTLSGGSADFVTGFGNPTDIPIVGDWNADGVDTPGVVRNAGWWLNNDFSGTVHHSFVYGLASDRPIVGDWNGNGVDTPGVHRGNRFYLSNDFAGTTHHDPVYGNHGDVPLGGDWNPQAMDSWEDEAVTETQDAGDLAYAAVTNDAPYVVSLYAPLVFIHPQEPSYPASARRWFIKYSSLKWARNNNLDKQIVGRGQINSIRLGERFRNTNPYRVTKTSGTYYTYDYTRPFDNSPARPNWLSPEEGFYLDLDDARRTGKRDLRFVPTYYYLDPQRRFITYWFFYPWNDGVGATYGDHEGDWERIVVKLDAPGNATHVALYRHDCYRVVKWEQINKVPQTKHPIVFSAHGSHASYGTAGDSDGNQWDTCTDFPVGGGNTVVDKTADASRGAKAWKTWNSLADVYRQPWYGFGGAWGQTRVGASRAPGPSGPGTPTKLPAPDDWMF